MEELKWYDFWAEKVHFARMYFTAKEAEAYAKEFRLTYKVVQK